MRKYSKKGWERRQKERKGYKEFFEKHIKIIKKEDKKCAECGCSLNGYHNEVAHILPKSYFKSIATNDKNILYLCPTHHNFYDDRSNEEIREMDIFPEVEKAFLELEEYITENLNYKHFSRWQT